MSFKQTPNLNKLKSSYTVSETRIRKLNSGDNVSYFYQIEKPGKYGIEMTHWNREMLVKVVIEKGIVDTISPRYISVILKKTTTCVPINPVIGYSQI